MDMEEKLWFVVQRTKGSDKVFRAYVSPMAISEDVLKERIRAASAVYDYEYVELSPSIWQGVKFLQDNREGSLNMHLEYLNYVCAELKDMNNGIEETINEMREEFQSLLEKEEWYEK